MFSLALAAFLAFHGQLDVKDFTVIGCEFAESVGRELHAERVVAMDPGGFDVGFDALDHEKGTARLTRDGREETVRILDGPLTMTFVGQSELGGLEVTSLFKSIARLTTIDGRHYQTYRAAMSRHTPTFDGPALASQFYGECRGIR